VDVFLGLLGILLWIVVVISLAMGVTWLVVRVFPTGKPTEPKDKPAADA
jgi:hypothetical protein